MKHYLRTFGLVFSVALNVAFVGSYAYRTLTKRPTFAYEELQLNADQHSRMVSSRDQFIRAVDQAGNNIIELQLELIDAIAAEPAYPATVDAKLEQIHSQQQSMLRVVVEHLMEDKSILDPAQKRKFFGLLKQRIRAERMPGPPWLQWDRTRQQSGPATSGESKAGGAAASGNPGHGK
jgi:hypothetical protein